MNKAQVVLDGFQQLVQQLTNEPREIREAGLEIVKDETVGAEVEIVQKYPVRAYGRPGKRGTLRGRVKSEFPSSSILVGIVRSTAPHAHIYEFGTKARYATTKRGKRAHRGISPGHPVTVPIARKRRERMGRRLGDMLRARGYQVSGV